MEAKIFIVDNEYSTIFALEHALRNPGCYDTMVCADVGKALPLIAEWQPQIVIAECWEINGGWLCRQLKKSPVTQDITVILTGRKGSDKTDVDVKDFLIPSCHCDDYISKPFNVENVLAVINTNLIISHC